MMAIRERQDERLDDLHQVRNLLICGKKDVFFKLLNLQHMIRVHEMSTSIGTEINEHIELIREVDDQVTLLLFVCFATFLNLFFSLGDLHEWTNGFCFEKD
jgi:hypothetical protein